MSQCISITPLQTSSASIRSSTICQANSWKCLGTTLNSHKRRGRSRNFVTIYLNPRASVRFAPHTRILLGSLTGLKNSYKNLRSHQTRRLAMCSSSISRSFNRPRTCSTNISRTSRMTIIHIFHNSIPWQRSSGKASPELARCLSHKSSNASNESPRSSYRSMFATGSFPTSKNTSSATASSIPMQRRR